MYNTLLLTDFYKLCHKSMYNPRIKQLTSYLTPRDSRLNIKEIVFFGLQGFIKEYLVKNFNENFFNRDIEGIKEEYYDVMTQGLGYSIERVDDSFESVKALHNLGYLPLRIRAIPEGTICPIKVPLIEITTTHKDFFWVGQSIEPLLSCLIWHPIVSATVANEYRKIANKYFNMTSEKHPTTGIADFSMRGQESLESAINSSAAFLTSFTNSSTVPVIGYLKENYPNMDNSPIAKGLTSTEHSVMCSDFAINGNEIDTFKRFLNDVYKDVSFSIVSDSYDYWNIIENVVPELKEDILNHEGFCGFRDDSGDPVESLCGIPHIILNEEQNSFLKKLSESVSLACAIDTLGEKYYDLFSQYKNSKNKNKNIYIETDLYAGVVELSFGASHFCSAAVLKPLYREKTIQECGTVEALYNIFNGEMNSKGYISLNSKVKAIYGDSITIARAEEIYKRLAEKGFASDCVSLGAGSFSMQCMEENRKFKPFTRDTFSIAIKTTHMVLDDGEEKFIFKDPKGGNKKSQKGLCCVFRNHNNKIVYDEGLTKKEQQLAEDLLTSRNLFLRYFENGKIFNSQSLEEIRDRLEIQRFMNYI